MRWRGPGAAGRQFSHLTGRLYPKGTPTYLSRDEVVAHFERPAREDGIRPRLDTAVERIDHGPQGWRLVTSSGDIDARHVVIATGFQNAPWLPSWPGEYSGKLLHACAYRTLAPYVGKRVLAVGSGSSGLEIAHDLGNGGAAKVWLSVRTPPNLLSRNRLRGQTVSGTGQAHRSRGEWQ